MHHMVGIRVQNYSYFIFLYMLPLHCYKKTTYLAAGQRLFNCTPPCCSYCTHIWKQKTKLDQLHQDIQVFNPVVVVYIKT